VSIPTKAVTGRHNITFTYVNKRLNLELPRTFTFDVVNEGSWDDTSVQDALRRRGLRVAVVQQGMPCGALGMGRYDSTGDTYLHATHPVGDRNADFVNFGARDVLHAGKYGQEYRSLVRFDLASARKGTRIVAAYLQVYLYGWGGGRPGRGTFEAYEVLVPWSTGRGTSLYSKDKVLPGEASWLASAHPGKWRVPGCGAPGVDRRAQPISTASVDRATKVWVTLELDADLVARWLDDPGRNFGVLLLGHGGRADFRASEFGDAPFRPRLVLGYR